MHKTHHGMVLVCVLHIVSTIIHLAVQWREKIVTKHLLLFIGLGLKFCVYVLFPRFLYLLDAGKKKKTVR